MASQTEGVAGASTTGPSQATAGGAVAAENLARNGEAAGGAASPNSASDWARLVHRALRGRYRFTVLLVLLAAGIGTAIAWQLAGPLFRSEGMVRIASALPAVIKETDQNRPIPMFDSFIQAQQEMVTSRAVLEAAVQDEAWRTVPMTEKKPSVEDLAMRLKAEVKG